MAIPCAWILLPELCMAHSIHVPAQLPPPPRVSLPLLLSPALILLQSLCDRIFLTHVPWAASPVPSQEFKLKEAGVNLVCSLLGSHLQRWHLGHSKLSRKEIVERKMLKSFQSVQSSRAVRVCGQFLGLLGNNRKGPWVEFITLMHLKCLALLAEASF